MAPAIDFRRTRAGRRLLDRYAQLSLRSRIAGTMIVLVASAGLVLSAFAYLADERLKRNITLDLLSEELTHFEQRMRVDRGAEPPRSARLSIYRSSDLSELPRRIAMLKPGVATDQVAKAFPKSTEIGFETEMAAFGLNFCHGLGLGLHERPLVSRLNSFVEPYELKAGMVFAVETFCPAKDGISAARIEEEVVLTPEGAKVISLYPADELPIANAW